jgi:hypothetical protein
VGSGDVVAAGASAVVVSAVGALVFGDVSFDGEPQSFLLALGGVDDCFELDEFRFREPGEVDLFILDGPAVSTGDFLFSGSPLAAN